ncbi:replication-associated protein [Pacific flying fox faeces associated circular DNA virus-6]|uniref:Replication-associated protein n=1 Tax=Pacific flying fox faeces associated circular DNA virus-6 TaxID=1796015 RepID=A0A140CTU1_9VIRU|nr:replication-associated protein [Pacific flying fox faeces associated circular DNA virus-6]
MSRDKVDLAPSRGFSKYWCFTAFASDFEKFTEIISDERVFSNSDLSYIIGGEELCPLSGRKHIQGFAAFASRKRLTACKKLFPSAHFERMRGSAREAIEYCKKDGKFVERGIYPCVRSSTVDNGSAKGVDRIKDFIELARAGNVDLCEQRHPNQFLRYFSQLKNLRKFDIERLSEALWRLDLRGPSFGIGKDASRSPSLRVFFFKKSQLKWWDGYNNENIILISDFDESCKWMVHYLKIWADVYPFNAEVKGSTIKIRPKYIIVTSNFRMDMLFLGTALDALKRRFMTFEFSGSGLVEKQLRNESHFNAFVLDALKPYVDEDVDASPSPSSSVLPNGGEISPFTDEETSTCLPSTSCAVDNP